MAIETAGIFFINNDNKLLVGHPTGHDFWSIPKGKLEEGETSYEAALRETWEETNVDLREAVQQYELDIIRYKSGKKKLKPFIIFEDENRKINSEEFVFKCNSIVDKDSKWNAGLPEMDDFKWITLEEASTILHHTQVECLDIITQLIKDKNGKKKR
jgi:8-oxo-dGTP pyrophosphatase MutT (NUDIX family)